MQRTAVPALVVGLCLVGFVALGWARMDSVRAAPANAVTAPHINEFVANHAGSDTFEFIEVFGAPDTDYAAYTLLQIEGDAAGAGVIDSVHPVGTTNATGHWTTGFLTNVLENGTLTLLLVEGFSGAVGTDLDTNDDGVLDVTPWTAIADAVAVSDGGVGDVTYAATVLAPDFDGGTFAPGGASRIPDGGSTWLRNDFDGAGLGFMGTPEVGEALNTPGAPNVLAECVLPFTPTYTIQGSGMTAAITGTVTTQGVIVGDYEGPFPALRGFYLQDPTGDGDPVTSDGIFVFNGNADTVSLGDLVRVTGTASESQDQTQVSATAIFACGTGTVEPVDVTLPFPTADYLERYEGMLVRLPQTLTVTEHFQLGRFGMVVMSSGDRLLQPTQVAQPGAPALALQTENALNRIIVDDALNVQNPDPILFGSGGQPLSASNTLRGGDTATGIVGVMTHTWAGNAASGNAYRVRPVNALGGSVPDFQPANPRPADAPDVGGTLRVGVFNVHNYFNTFGAFNCTLGVGGEPADCRGADNAQEFERQVAKTIAAILGLDADVLAIVEIEHDGYGPDSAIQHLVDRLNDATAPGTWAFIDADAGTGDVNALGTDAIKVGLLYRPDAVTPIGTTAALANDEFVNGGDASPRNRPALAQAFASTSDGEIFIAVANHLKSKGSACDTPDAGDGQGNCNDVRTNAALELLNWLAGDPTGTDDPDVLILGDLNAYAKEDPIAVFEAEGFVNLQAALSGPADYTFVFDGQWGSLDHALASPTLLDQVTGAAAWAINADEPNALDYNTNFKSPGLVASLYAADAYRSSDHDPIVIGLDLATPQPPDLVVGLQAGWSATETIVVPDSATLAVALAASMRVPATVPGLSVHALTFDTVVDGDQSRITSAEIFHDINGNGSRDDGEPVLGATNQVASAPFTVTLAEPRTVGTGETVDVLLVFTLKPAGTARRPLAALLAGLILAPLGLVGRRRALRLTIPVAAAILLMVACGTAKPDPGDPSTVRTSLTAVSATRGADELVIDGLPVQGPLLQFAP